MGIFSKKIKVNSEYIKQIDESGIFSNRHADSLPQTVVAGIIEKHFDGSCGKKKRALVLGFDGARADSMLLLLQGRDQKVSGNNFDSKYSAVKLLKESGGLYLTYAGGDADKPETWQETSTAQGWAAILTGKWGCENGVVRHVPIKRDFPTVLLSLARRGITARFNASWADHFTVTYSEEIKTAEAENVPLEFTKVPFDAELHEKIHADIESGAECIFGIYETPDWNGHNSGFGNGNPRYSKAVSDLDRIAYEHIEYIKSRPEYENEDWLFIITSDHGGHGCGHGRQRTEDRETFLAVNRRLDV